MNVAAVVIGRNEGAVVASRAVDHPMFFRDGENRLLPDPDVGAWTNAIVGLVEDTQTRCRIAVNGWEGFRQRLTSDTFARLLDSILRKGADLPLHLEHEELLARCALRRREIGMFNTSLSQC